MTRWLAPWRSGLRRAPSAAGSLKPQGKDGSFRPQGDYEQLRRHVLRPQGNCVLSNKTARSYLKATVSNLTTQSDLKATVNNLDGSLRTQDIYEQLGRLTQTSR